MFSLPYLRRPSPRRNPSPPSARYSACSWLIPLLTNTNPIRSYLRFQCAPFPPTPICQVWSTPVYANDSCCPSFQPQRPNTPTQSFKGCSKLIPKPYLMVVCGGCAVISGGGLLGSGFASQLSIASR